MGFGVSEGYFDLRVHGRLLAVVLLVLVGVHADVVERELLLDPVLEHLPLLQCQRIRLGNHGNHIDRLAQLLQYHNINRLERMARRRDEVETAVDARVLDIPLSLRRQLLPQICAVLVLDVLDDRVPAAVVVDEVAVAGCVDDVEAEAHTVLFDDVRDGVDLGGLADRLVGCQAAFGVDEVRGEDGVDEGALAETGLACSINTVSEMPLNGFRECASPGNLKMKGTYQRK